MSVIYSMQWLPLFGCTIITRGQRGLCQITCALAKSNSLVLNMWPRFNTHQCVGGTLEERKVH